MSAENVDIEDYEMQTRKALMGEFITGFECELKQVADKDDGTLQLIWKKVVEKDHIKVYIFVFLTVEQLHCLHFWTQF